MRASILIAAHNEREALLNTVRACRERSAGVDCEIVVGDDASADGSAAALAKEFPSVHVARHEQRQGVSPTRQLAARQAQGEAFLFLDAHCNPEPGAIARLVNDVRETGGDALITPKIPALDAARWKNTTQQVGHGYRLELERFDLGTTRPGPFSSRPSRRRQDQGRHYRQGKQTIGHRKRPPRDAEKHQRVDQPAHK
jgi:glycosyltransferase involved in cell wall biosynthesis